MNTKYKIAIIFSLIVALSPIMVSAQTYTALEPLPCIPGGGVTCPGGAGNLQATFSFQNYVQYIFNLIIAIAAAAAVFMIVFGGLQYMTTDSWNGKSAGLEKAKNAIYGLLLVLGSYLILRTVDPRLVAIPTTLVKPLNINYQATGAMSTPDFFGFLEDQTRNQLDMLNENNKKILADVTQARATVTSLEQQRNELCDNIWRDISERDRPNDCAVVLEEADKIRLYPDAVRQVRVLDEQIRNNKIFVATEVGVGLMNGEILKCAAGIDFDTCRNMILRFRGKYNSQLGSLSEDPTLKLKLDDYARYSAALAYAYSQVGIAVETASLTPFQAALQTSLHTVSTTVIGAAGAVIGGVLSGGTLAVVGGGAAGAIAYDYTTSLTQALNNARKTEQVTLAAANIARYAVPTVASIRDPQLQQAARSQLTAIINSLKK